MIDHSETLSRRPLAAVCLLLLGLAVPGEARSSFTARFADAVAGPDVEQSARLIVDYFPGDGEAVVGLKARIRSPDAQLARVVSQHGQAELQSAGFRVDYSSSAIGSQLSDTLLVHLVTPSRSVPVDLYLSTNVDTGEEPAHRVSASLAILPPLRVALEIEPGRVYPGEAVEFLLRAGRREMEERVVDSVAATWPAGITPVGDPVASRSIDGDALEIRQSVRVHRDLAGALTVAVHVAGAGLAASPVVAPILEVAPVPSFDLQVLDESARQDMAVLLRLRWRNQGEVAIPLRSLGAAAAAGFTGARLEPGTAPGGTGGVSLEADEEKGSVEVAISSHGDLAPGEAIEVDLRLTPQATGPFTFSGHFQPEDRTVSVTLGSGVIQVVAAESSLSAAASLARTDLELARAGLEPELRRALASIPLARGATLRFSDSGNDDGNWVVEGLLTDLLLEKGVRVLADSSAAETLHYRLADSRVVYSPAGAGWNLFDDRRSREARMEVFLRLEDADSHVRWVRRVTGQIGESSAPAAASWLGGAKGVDQVSVAADHRAIEIGLSGMIVGGLFFVFFAP